MITMTQPAFFIGFILLLFVEVVILFSVRGYYQKKIKQQQERFAGYLKYLDEENKRLKEKVAKLSKKKMLLQI